MAWLQHYSSFLTTQEQLLGYGQGQSNTTSQNASAMPAYDGSAFMFEGLDLLSPEVLDFLSQDSSNFGSAGITLSSQGNTPPNLQNNNYHRLSEASTTPSPLLCDWPGCKRPGPFANKGTLKRHTDTQHLAPRSFICHHQECRKAFSRKDNLNNHLRAIHKENPEDVTGHIFSKLR